jgi:hypothetical protein
MKEVGIKLSAKAKLYFILLKGTNSYVKCRKKILHNRQKLSTKQKKTV